MESTGMGVKLHKMHQSEIGCKDIWPVACTNLLPIFGQRWMMMMTHDLQESITKQQAEQEAGLREMQGLVGAALAVPREVVQPALAAVGKRHMSILKQQAMLQLQGPLVAAVTQCIGQQQPRSFSSVPAYSWSSSCPYIV